MDEIKKKVLDVILHHIGKSGPFNFYMYAKFGKDGFEEYDVSAEVNWFERTNNIKRPSDPDEVFAKELAQSIIAIANPTTTNIPYLRIIVNVDGNINVSLSK